MRRRDFIKAIAGSARASADTRQAKTREQDLQALLL